MTLAIGHRVRLLYAPFGTPGTIVDLRRGKAEVRWDDLAITTKHALEALLHATQANA